MMKSENSRRRWLMMIALLPLGLMAQRAPGSMDSTQPRIYQFSIQQAVDYARKNNVQVKNALLDVQIQQQTNREVTGSAYPQLSGSGSIVYNAKLPVSLVPAEFFGGTPGTFQKLAFGVKWGATYGASISQILFDGQIFTGLKARGTLIDFYNKGAEVTEETIRANVYKLYYQLAISKTQIALIDTTIELASKLLHDTKIIYDNGFAEKLDVDKTEVVLANLNTSRANVLTQVANGYVGLKMLMGMPIKDSLALTDSINESELKEGILDATNFSYESRKEFQYSNLSVKLREYDIQRYRLSKIPTLSVNGYYNKNAQRNKFDFFKSGGDWFDISAFTLEMKIPIFNGFATNARISRAKLYLRQANNQREDLKISIDDEIQTAKNNYTNAISSLDYQKRNMALAQSVYQQTKKKYEVGTGSQTEINTAQTDLQTAQNNYINSLYNAFIAKVDFLKATGKLQ